MSIVGANKLKKKIGRAKAKRGRPFADTMRVSCRLPVELVRDIDEWRSSTALSRPGAIRFILEDRYWPSPDVARRMKEE